MSETSSCVQPERGNFKNLSKKDFDKLFLSYVKRNKGNGMLYLVISFAFDLERLFDGKNMMLSLPYQDSEDKTDSKSLMSGKTVSFISSDILCNSFGINSSIKIS